MFEDTLEWRIGRLSLHGLGLNINGRHWIFDRKDWTLRGFVGSMNKLKRRLALKVGPKLLLHTSGQAISSYTGKEAYAFGDLSVAAATKMGICLSNSVQRYTGKDKYEFGDVTKATVNKVGTGVADAVQGFTGKEKYQFGDISKTAVNKIGAEVSDTVQRFTGKEYEFGDVTKTVLSRVKQKLKPSRSKTGQQEMDEPNIMQ